MNEFKAMRDDVQTVISETESFRVDQEAARLDRRNALQQKLELDHEEAEFEAIEEE